MRWKLEEFGTRCDAIGLHRKWLVLREDGCGYMVAWANFSPSMGVPRHRSMECMAFPYAAGAVTSWVDVACVYGRKATESLAIVLGQLGIELEGEL